MSKTKTTKGVTQKKITIHRDGEIFEFDNTDNLPSDEFGVMCEEAIDAQIAARKAARKYSALGEALLGQIARGEKASDYDVRKADLLEFETANPNLSKGYFDRLNKADGTAEAK